MNGQNINFWCDHWIEDSLLIIKANLIMENLIDQKANVSDFINRFKTTEYQLSHKNFTNWNCKQKVKLFSNHKDGR